MNAAVPIPLRPELLKVDVGAPYSVAQCHLERRHVAGGSYTLWFHRGSFFIWDGSHYCELKNDAVRQIFYEFLHNECVTFEGKAINPKKAMIDNLVDALKSVAYLADSYAPPCWISVRGDSFPPAASVVPVANGLLNLQTRELLPHNAAFLSTFGLPFKFERDAPTEPPGWLAFLQSVWPDDAESIRCLRQMFGYFLTSDHRHQKIFLIHGPKRSGKGIIAAIVKALVGPDNYVSPTLASFGYSFGLEPLINASVACISDARISSRTDLGQVTENLLKISAGDHSSIPRKFRLNWEGVLPARLLLLSNELPRIADASGALASRFVVLRMTRSFYGREDKGLEMRLKKELPAILNWALVGLDDLNAEGWFSEPASSRESVNELHDLGSPVGAFVREECVLHSGACVATETLFDAWVRWCNANHRDERLAGDLAGFGSKLRSVAPGVVRRRMTVEGNRGYFYDGIRRKSTAEKYDDE